MLRKATHFIFILLVFSQITIWGQNTNLTLNTVVIDPGHGGKDPGTSVGSLFEKNIVLDVARRVGKYIKKYNPDVNVIFTRETDRFVPLDQRAEIANKNKADLFISIHVNYYQSSSTYGSETYILGNHRSEDNLKVAQMENSVILLEDDYSTRYEGFDPNSSESYIMFELIQNEFLEQSRYFADLIQNSFTENADRRSRGVKQAGFLVLRETIMPSILVELGYISNVPEKKYLSSDDGQDQLAIAIAKAFGNYKKKFDDRSVINIHETNSINSNERKIPNKELLSSDKIKKGQWYAIQIMASKKSLSNKQLHLKNDEFYYHLIENGWHKYYTGFTQNYEEVINLKKSLDITHKGAFLVVFNDGNKEKFKKF